MSDTIDRNLLPPTVDEYISELLIVKARSKATVNQYITDLYLFFCYLEKCDTTLSPGQDRKIYDLSHIDVSYLSKITLKDINNFLIFCSSDRANSAKTRARKASSIRGFFKYISEKMNYIDHNPAAQLQVAPPKKSLPKYLTLEQSIAMLNSVNGENKERDYCILTLFLNCGLRLAELCGLNVNDVNFENETLIVTGKGNKQRLVYLNDACIKALKDYLAVRPAGSLKGDDRKALFISRLNKRIGRQAVQLMVYHYLEEIGLNGQHYSVHKLRHTAATLMYQHGEVDVLILKDMLGHEQLSTTEIYTHLENKQLRDAAKKNPLSSQTKHD
jgi:site-specific recombinase XerD